MASIAIEMFRQMGIPREQYAKHLFVGQGPSWVINTFMLKKSPFTRQEIDDLFRFYNVGHGRRILYAPYRTPDLPDLENNLYYKMVTAEDPSRYWRMGCFNFEPPTDNKPFFNRMKVMVQVASYRAEDARKRILLAELANSRSPGVVDPERISVLRAHEAIARIDVETGLAASTASADEQLQWRVTVLEDELLRLHEVVSRLRRSNI